MWAKSFSQKSPNSFFKNRENWGYKNHSTRLKNSLEGKCRPKVFPKSRQALFSDRLLAGCELERSPSCKGPETKASSAAYANGTWLPSRLTPSSAPVFSV